jgi:hypothetical protein
MLFVGWQFFRNSIIMEMTKKTIYLSFLLLLYFKPSCFSQTVKNPTVGPDFVKYAGHVEIIDSQYCLLITVKVIGNESIEVNKIRSYNDRNFGSEHLYIQKIIRGFAVNLTSPEFHYPRLDPDYDKLQKVNSSTPLTDTIVLDDILPFEVGGNYLMGVEIGYYIGAASYIAAIYNIPFTVFFLPPKSRYH